MHVILFRFAYSTWPEMCSYSICVYALVISAMDYSSIYPWAKKDLLKETFYYTTRMRIRELRENGCVLSKKREGFVKTVECREGEPVCCDESSDPNGPFCFFYATFFKKGPLRLPLSIFEKEILTELNVSPTQLHPNSWDFI